MNTPGQYKLAATLVALIGIVHLAVMGMGQFKSDVTGLIVPMVIYLLLALLLFRGKRWGAWIAFLYTLIGITGAILRFYSSSNSPDWVFPSVITLNLLATVVLFVILWKSNHKYKNRLETHSPATVSSHHSKA